MNSNVLLKEFWVTQELAANAKSLNASKSKNYNV
jgi:hypothetical protein